MMIKSIQKNPLRICLQLVKVACHLKPWVSLVSTQNELFNTTLPQRKKKVDQMYFLCVFPFSQRQQTRAIQGGDMLSLLYSSLCQYSSFQFLLSCAILAFLNTRSLRLNQVVTANLPQDQSHHHCHVFLYHLWKNLWPVLVTMKTNDKVKVQTVYKVTLESRGNLLPFNVNRGTSI